MNKSKLSIATACRALLNVFLVVALVALASLIGVGGAALWIYSRSDLAQSAPKHASPRLRSDVAASETRTFPALSPMQSDSDTPAQLTPARYVPTDSEIATLSDTPRYTYVSYNGGRQQAHLRVNTVLSAPAPLTVSATADPAPLQTSDRPPLTDTASHYITDAHGRVIGIDGSEGAAAEARVQQVTVAPATPVQLVPEVRVAAPVVTRKALPVDEETVPASTGFNVLEELSRDDDRPVARAIPVARVTRSTRPAMFGASDNFQSFGRD